MGKELFNLLYITSAILVILLSMFNLQNIDKKQIKVLGAETDNMFWQEFVVKHPTYIDAWVELGRMDIVKQIDPNFSQEP
jgi:hypothetical protein